MKNTLSNQEIDELGEGVYSSFVKSQPLNSLCVDIEGLAEYLGMTIEYADFAEKDRERLGFLANGIKGLAVRKNGRTETIVYPYKTIVLQQYLLNDHESGRKLLSANDDSDTSVVDVLRQVYYAKQYPEKASMHYFSVILNGVDSTSNLNNYDDVLEYLSQNM